jgi:energy-converting hydrogenase Eha subunit C
MAWFDWVVIASIELRELAAFIFVTAMVVAGLILVVSTVLFFFYLVVTVQRIRRSKR